LAIGDKLDKMFELRQKKDKLNEKLSEINKAIDQLEFSIIQDMEVNELDSIKAESGSATKKMEMYPNIEDYDAFFNFLVETGNKDMIEKRVGKAAFRAYVEENNKYPDGLGAYEKVTLNYRKASKK
jgi:hypothetical protein